MSDQERRFRLTNTRPALPHGAISKGSADDKRTIQVTVILKPAPLPDDQPAAVRHSEVTNVGAGNRAALSRNDLEEIYSPDDAHIALVEAFAEEHDLEITRASRIRHDVVLKGPVGAMNVAFGVEIEDFEHESGTCHAHQDDVHLPDSLRDIVVGVIGLNTVPLSRSMASAGNKNSPVFTADEIAEHYNFPTSTGRGQRIAILNFGECGYYKSDIEHYCKNILRIEMPKIREFSVNGSKCNPPPYEIVQEIIERLNNGETDFTKFSGEQLAACKATMESTMDIQVACGVASGADIDLYFSTNDLSGWYEAIYAALKVDEKESPPPTVISASWGAPEALWGKSQMDQLKPALEKAEKMQVPVCCSSGDLGSLDALPGKDAMQAKVNHPASSPHVLACGGTSFKEEDGVVLAAEISWRSQTAFGEFATGGGVSGYQKLPAYQESANVPSHDGLSGDAWLDTGLPENFRGRGVPDVAAFADAGYQIFVGGQVFLDGGTSASTPVWAGLLACFGESLDRRIGWINELIYQPELSATFKPVVGGNNKLGDTGAAFFEADKNWNGCCGLGVPDGKALLECLRKAYAEEDR